MNWESMSWWEKTIAWIFFTAMAAFVIAGITAVCIAENKQSTFDNECVSNGYRLTHVGDNSYCLNRQTNKLLSKYPN